MQYVEILISIYGGDQNVQREKREILRGNFDDMKMLLNMAPE